MAHILKLAVVLLVSTSAFAADVKQPPDQPKPVKVPIPGPTGEFWSGLLDADPGPLLQPPAGEPSVSESLLKQMEQRQ
jgi:hypothetical protein